MLTCSCDDYDSDVWYYVPDDFVVMPKLARRKRCRSCREFIEAGSQCLCFEFWRNSRGEYEESRFGGEIELASRYLCESCGEIYLNLKELNYCLDIEMYMGEYLKEYWQMTGFDPAKYEV